MDQLFEALHFVFYNRYARKGAQMEAIVDPASIQFQTKQGKQVYHHTAKMIPRAAKELQQNPIAYSLCQQAFAPYFSWMSSVIETHLPEEYEKLRKFAEVLPGNELAPAHPFAGFVINLNVATALHRDWGDESICVVTVVSDCEGGELVLLEPGLVLELRHGDTVIFPSSKISHFNQHFNGMRSSIVCHSDKFSRTWVGARNGWETTPTFRSSQPAV
ncbi:hypothetical protein BDN72DRAFT_781076 [Pluteus cervinus]|uniref:Uncharacterized protein n=1 Tax=Pluteus cervinus TaxID=181527 RepID=A0ACD3A0J1_9AGAR|nr:hypothetical protein BDN72DRAFT_781076 [Pluteus cervinus]